METITFDKLLLKTAFCCMASDGKIDTREVDLIKIMCGQSPLFNDFDFTNEINILLEKINERGTEFIQNYFQVLNNSNLSEQEQLIIIDFAIKTINADEVVEYSEVKFFKAIRKCLTITDEIILTKYPDLEFYLEEDINIESKLDKLISNYFSSVEIPKFEQLNVENLKNE
ncbi:TerB family tellurite resistance protein [Flavobacterium sp. F-328]|uniref:TerB family tellurite resistance protein n=1 Tax=Flavobacterium erciyesense TaxID=2825842 RepID=A0ABS5D6T1_9FLAO|nr:TerB family tellurite resistance protein [Flavobacterium erciyesense]MBQ0909746.1 TerB family tellurite resistance protein [Flavobacterium erciyesense]